MHTNTYHIQQYRRLGRPSDAPPPYVGVYGMHVVCFLTSDLRMWIYDVSILVVSLIFVNTARVVGFEI